MTVHVTDEQWEKINGQRKDMDRRIREGALQADYVIAGQQQLLEHAVAIDTSFGFKRHVPRRFRIGRSFTPEATIEAELQRCDEWIAQGYFGTTITHDMLAALGPAPKWPTNRFTCVLPRIVIPGGPHANLAAYWELLKHCHPDATHWEELYQDAARIHLLEGITLEPGISWAVLDLGCHTNRKPADVRSATKSPTVEPLAAACLFPAWIKAMISGEAPNVWLTGFIVDAPGNTPGRDVPGLDGYGGHPHLSAGYGSYAGPNWACPELRES